MNATVPPALKRFIWDIQSMVELTEEVREILFIGADLMTRLVATDDWLPDAFARSAANGPCQHQIYADGAERFCVVSTVLGPGESLPVLQAPFWQLVGVLRGAVTVERLAAAHTGEVQPAIGGRRALPRGAVERIQHRLGEVVRLTNASQDEGALLIQVYGGEIGASPRFAVTAEGRLEQIPFGYANGPDAPAYDIWSIQTEIED
jgi:predicted metal-dependent enzyme (double-stranded beta helix superfamily)